MKAGLFHGTGPILILTTFETLKEPRLAEKLKARGRRSSSPTKYPSKSQTALRHPFFSNSGDLSQTDDLRILDIDGIMFFTISPSKKWGTLLFGA